ncbi:hypothetical protein LOK49_LG05G02224 [Camellia lanceoleosa]|uniref:Uncharacterized protein n=1 Tax=Camellia lanceoleosa TaxID=1840588 RepID=A0ACC0HUI7_9ERIC|nr:hypothetical protein LOK49_LG05G02224 [Camellia lanceoleosa]
MWSYVQEEASHGRTAPINPFNQESCKPLVSQGVPLGGMGSGSISRDFRGEFRHWQIIPGLALGVHSGGGQLQMEMASNERAYTIQKMSLRQRGKETVMVTKKAVRDNPTALLALSWYWASGGVGSKDMFVLPYKDSLLLFSRYLQQLVIESLGKEFDLDGNRLREGMHNFVTFIEVLRDKPPDVTDLIVESMTVALKRSRTTCFAGSCRSTYMLDIWFGFTEIN